MSHKPSKQTRRGRGRERVPPTAKLIAALLLVSDNDSDDDDGGSHASVSARRAGPEPGGVEV